MIGPARTPREITNTVRAMVWHYWSDLELPRDKAVEIVARELGVEAHKIKALATTDGRVLPPSA